MEVKQAVTAARIFLVDLFATEQIRNVGLEEVEFDDGQNAWRITLGFSRPWDQGGLAARAGLEEPRSYKVVTLSNADGKVLSVKNRQPLAA